ncbi:MAG TPA: VCBS repeat-containing protein, partial [Verrucomicrobiae bacterium]|nr:VCBS repeat-containing protein [Verrucomicrobiae bacterium]
MRPIVADTNYSHSKLLHKHKLKRKNIEPFKTSPPWEFIPSVAAINVSEAIAAGGDLDGDGFADVLAAEPLFNSARGRILFFFGSSRGLPETPQLTLEGNNPGDAFGTTVQMVGDVNGDGLDDFLASERNERNGFRAWVYFGHRERRFQRIEWSNATWPFPIGDINGDNFDDVAQYVPSDDLVYVYQGSEAGLGATPSCILRSEQKGSHFGHDIASAGDINGDGCDDLLVGAMKFNGRYQAGG